MKIGFFGTPEISSQCCEGLLAGHELLFVVASEDKPSGRNRKITLCPAKKFALSKNIPVFQPENLMDPAFISAIRRFKADIYVVVAFGKKIPGEIYNYPPHKTINLHPSLLPKYRGAAPVEWAIMNGEKTTGISVQLINDTIDGGDVIVQEEMGIDDDMTAGGLYELIAAAGCRLLGRAINMLETGEASPAKQEDKEATFCGKIDKKIAHIHWNRNAFEIHNQVRGLNPKPSAWTIFRGMNIRIFSTRPCTDPMAAVPGPAHIKVLDKKRLLAGTGGGCIEILMIQPENKKVMDAASFINGYRPVEGDHFI